MKSLRKFEQDVLASLAIYYQARRASGQNFIVHKAGDSTREGVLANVRAKLDSLDDKYAHQVTFKRYQKPRSVDSNEYLWACCYPLAVRELGFTAEDWHEEMLMRHFGKREVAKPGVSEWVPVRTTTKDENGNSDVLGSFDFWNFVEHVRREFAQAGVYIPEPDPFWKERREAAHAK